VEVDLSGIITEAQRLRDFPDNAKQSVSRAKSTFRRRLPVEARRDIQNEYNLPAARINKGLSVTDDGVAIVLTGSGRSIGLVEFSGRWGGAKTQGATASVFASGGSHNYAGTFIATGLSGNRQIFDRWGPKQRMQKGRYAGQMRQPLKTLYGPSIAQMLRKGDRETRLTDVAQEVLSTEIVRLL
jgi:hypothetical protein